MDVTQHIRGSQPARFEASKVSKDTKINISELMANYKQPYGKVATHKTIDTELNSQLVYEIRSVNKVVRADVINVTEDTIVVDRGGDTIPYSYEDFDKVGYIHASGDDNLLERNSQYFDDSKEDLLANPPKVQVTAGGVERIAHDVKIIGVFGLIMAGLVFGSVLVNTLYFEELNTLLAISIVPALGFLNIRYKEQFDYSNLLRA